MINIYFLIQISKLEIMNIFFINTLDALFYVCYGIFE